MENSRIICKESNKEVVKQEKIKLLEVKVRKQYIARSKKYPVKITLKEVGLKILDSLRSQLKLDKKYFS